GVSLARRRQLTALPVERQRQIGVFLQSHVLKNIALNGVPYIYIVVRSIRGQRLAVRTPGQTLQDSRRFAVGCPHLLVHPVPATQPAVGTGDCQRPPVRSEGGCGNRERCQSGRQTLLTAIGHAPQRQAIGGPQREECSAVRGRRHTSQRHRRHALRGE